MFEFTVYDKSSAEISEMVRELRNMGLEPRVDFDFSFVQGQWDFYQNEETRRQHTVFRFYNEKHGSLFALKWS